MKTEPRRQEILNLLEQTGTINVNELAERFQVSLVTIRNDLDDLEKEGLLQRTLAGQSFPIAPGLISLFVSAFKSSVTKSAPSRSPL